MDIVLWRHADAEDGIPDLERRLTAKGAKQAKKVATWLATRLPKGARVVASPAKRAQQTARALAGKFETVAALGTDADAKSVLAAVGWPADDDATVVVVGHQPALGQAAARARSATAVGARAPHRSARGRRGYGHGAGPSTH